MKKTCDRIEAVIAEIRRGKMVIVVDDEDRENEGDLIIAGQHVTPAAVNFMAKFGRGLICVPTTAERLQQLGIDRMVHHNRESFRTDFQVSVDAAHGITTGISAGRPRADDSNHGRADGGARGPGAARPRVSAARQGPAESCNGPATPKPRWTWRTWPACGPSACCARS